MLTAVVGDAKHPDLRVVVLHGYAMEPEDLLPFARSMGVPGLYCFPRGPHRASPSGSAWWPIDAPRRAAALARGPRDLVDEYPAQRDAARAALADLLARERRHCERLVLAGFSQGGMLACDTLLQEAAAVDALALFSASRIARDEWEPQHRRLRGLPVLVSHGRADADLSFQAGSALFEWIHASGAAARFVGFDGGHEIPLAVWREFRTVLREQVARAPVNGGNTP